MKKFYSYLPLFFACLISACSSWRQDDPANALRNIALLQCVPNQQKNHSPAPCTKVDLTHQYVLLKDRNGPLQFLLMPSYRIDGIESPKLLNSSTPNFFRNAWQQRSIMSQTYGQTIPDSAIALTLNSRLGRTQNHFHIHISCIRSDIRAQVDALAITTQNWQAIPKGILGHTYFARQISPQELRQNSPFLILAQKFSANKESLGDYSLAMLSKNDNFILLATKRNLLEGNWGSTEEIQDHQCHILSKQNKATTKK